MKRSVFDNDGFVLIECKKGDVLCEFILNKGFDKGVTTSENYHFHSSYEIHAAVSGELHILVEDRDIFLTPGMICVIPPNSVHYVFGNEASYRISYRFNFSRVSGDENGYFSVFEKAYGSLSNACVVENCTVYQKYLSVAAENLLNSLPEFMAAELLFLAAYDIAASVYSIYPLNTNTSDRCSYPLMAENIEEFFNKNYSKEVTVSDLSSYLNFSNRHTERIMQKLFGMSFGEMLNKKRLVTAKLLIRITDMPIKEIAEKCGFEDQAYFSRKFKAVNGISPQNYKKTIKCNDE